MDRRRDDVVKRLVWAALVFVAGLAAGYALATVRTGDSPDKEIRRGRASFTNPLLDCEISTYSAGRELPPFNAELRRLVAGLIARGEADKVAIYFRDLDNGPWFGIDEKETFTPGSLLKVPLIMACLLQAELDPSFLRKEILYRGLPDQDGIAKFVAEVPLVPGRAYTVGQLIEQVAVYSDNYAALLLDETVDRDILSRLYRDLGLDPELVSDPLKPAAISPRNFGHFFRVLYNASYLDRQTSETLLASLSRATYQDGLVAGVPPGTVVAHKFGVNTVSISGAEVVQLHDCGIVYSAQRPFFLCVMTRGADEQRLAQVIAQTARFVFGKVEQPLPNPTRGLFK